MPAFSTSVRQGWGWPLLMWSTDRKNTRARCWLTTFYLSQSIKQ
uniref:Uncharacterized protein n=1 Tax=Anguilla anguilla TaxID=7936 RepID=A0A0E9SX90_ANGAN